MQERRKQQGRAAHGADCPQRLLDRASWPGRAGEHLGQVAPQVTKICKGRIGELAAPTGRASGATGTATRIKCGLRTHRSQHE
jgi:hypothetical protein